MTEIALIFALAVVVGCTVWAAGRLPFFRYRNRYARFFDDTAVRYGCLAAALTLLLGFGVCAITGRIF